MPRGRHRKWERHLTIDTSDMADFLAESWMGVNANVFHTWIRKKLKKAGFDLRKEIQGHVEPGLLICRQRRAS